MIKLDEKSGVLSQSDLAFLYANTKEDIYFNNLWESVKLFAIKICGNYPSIEFEDKISISMQCLMDCCNNLKEGQNILTLYGGILKNRLYDTWGKKMQAKKYKVNSEAYSLEKLYEDVNFQPTAQIDEFNIDLFSSECHLLEIESLMIKLIYEGYSKTEITKRLNIKSNVYNILLEGIKEKINSNYLEEGFSR